MALDKDFLTTDEFRKITEDIPGVQKMTRLRKLRVYMGG
jgi:hypothetical protein